MNKSWSATLALLLITSCATLFPPPLPQLAPGFQREKVSQGSSTCSNRNCRHNVRVGEHRFRVETKTRTVSAKELTGASAAERAAGGLIGWTLRQAGINTVDEQIVVGTRTVTEQGALWSLVCQVAWIDQRDKSKSETTERRITEGMECRQQPAHDSANVHTPWRFRLGVAPALDSLKPIADTLSISPSGSMASVPVHLERSLPDSKRYSLAEESFGTILGTPRSGGWRVTRDDGGTVAALRLPPAFSCLGNCALDFGSAVEEERVVLRFIAAALMVPLR